MKKLLLSLGSLSALVAPITAVISCGTSEAEKIASKLNIKLGKQDATNGVELTFTGVTGVINGAYYFSKKELEAGKEFELPSATAGQKTKFKVVTAIDGTTSNVSASLETVPATGTGVALSAGVAAAAGDPTKLVFSKDGVSASLTVAQVATLIKGALEKEAVKSLFNDDKKDVKAAINRILKPAGKEITDDAGVNFTATGINFGLTALTPAATKAETKYGLTFGKQEANGFTLTFAPNTTAKVAAGTYYFPAAALAQDKEILVNSTEAGKIVKLKVKTAITAAGALASSLETTVDTTADVATTAAAGSTGAFFVKNQNGVVESLAAQANVISKITTVLINNYKITAADKAKLETNINALTGILGLKEDGTLTITNPTVTIDATKIVDIQ